MSMRPSRHAQIADPTREEVAGEGRVKACIQRHIWPLVFLFPILATGGWVSSSAQSTDEEYRIKAAFIFHFAQLVDWPQETQTGEANSLFLCTIGEDPFQGALESTVAGKAVGNKIIRIRHLGSAEDMQACQILFFGRVQSKRIPTLLATLHNAPVLTVGESAGFLGAGGMICFVLDQNNVRFGINLDAAEAAKLKIGSRLLLLAQTVIGEKREK
jgi:hypothetical protein